MQSIVKQCCTMKHSVLSQIAKLLIILLCSVLNVRMVKTQRSYAIIAQQDNSLIQLQLNANAVLDTGKKVKTLALLVILHVPLVHQLMLVILAKEH